MPEEASLYALKQTAAIIGPQGAAAHALADLERRQAAGEDAAIYIIGTRLVVGPRVKPSADNRFLDIRPGRTYGDGHGGRRRVLEFGVIFDVNGAQARGETLSYALVVGKVSKRARGFVRGETPAGEAILHTTLEAFSMWAVEEVDLVGV